MKTRRIFSIISLFTALTLLVGTLVFRQSLYDWYRLQQFTPSSEIVALADNTTMLPGSRRLFYVQHPQLSDKTTFNEHCRRNEQTIVLGCYIHGQGIYLLDVTDERLSGIEQVTAAHELLHAAYERLSSKERAQIDALVVDAFDKISNDRLSETIELYRRQDAGIVPNELHSILGTEVRVLSQELEDYYERYFSDRSKIVNYSERYEQAFLARHNMILDFDAQLSVLKGQIETLQDDLRQADTELQAQRTQMNSQRNSGQTDAYNAQVPSYNLRVNQYNQDIDELSSLVVQYNDVVQKRNAVASEEAELVEAIDSREIVPQQQ